MSCVMPTKPSLLFNLPSIPNWEYMTAEERWAALPPAYREFMTTKPNPPGHAEYMARAAKRYPKLPPGAQQAALYALEMHGPKQAARYAANALSRWAIKGFKFVMPARSHRGVCKHSKTELAERMVRYHAWMAEGAKKLERQRAASRRKFAETMRSIGHTNYESRV